MKNKTWIAVLAGSIIIAAFGLGFNQIFADPENDPLSTQEVTEIIADRYPGELEYLDLEYEQGQMVYVGKVTNEKGSYEIMVDAKTGTILDVKALDNTNHTVAADAESETETETDIKEELNGATDDDDSSDGSKVEQNPTADLNDGKITSQKQDDDQDDSKNTNSVTGTPSSEGSKNNNYIGMEAAKQIALEKVNGIIKEIELDSDDGIVYYEIEMKTDQGEAEFEINAITGEIISFSVDSKKSTNGLGLDLTSLIGIVEAKRIAQEQVSGTVKEIELEKDDGRIYYDIEMKTSRGEVEIEIDARTGEIISIEYDD